MNEGELASELRRLEEALLSADIRTDGERVAQLLAEDFLEFGSSGRRYDRQAAIAGLLDEPHGLPTTRVIEDFAARRLADGLALVTYTVIRRTAGVPERRSLRSSLWRRETGGWRMCFHQGTIIPEPPTA
ncbi:DUF4440 domain-containing protein [Ancylobacter sp. G4_0304]|uniref:nuclear transport factor 2 family protein n=1 Tax=Ancylobacter sp. G4_0304 TaxID=3114289 RepID=UPI0039C6698A